MNTGNTGFPEVDLGKYWPAEFSEHRDPHDDDKWASVEAKVDATGDGLGLYVSSGDTDSPFDIEFLEKFCLGRSREDVISGIYCGSHRKTVWLDDRDSIRLRGKRGPHMLTASELYRELMIPRFGYGELPDASRRLIYVSDLDPACIHALAATASCHEVPVLRDAIYQHLAFETAIAVKTPSDGYLKFQLDLHLPFYILNNTKPHDTMGGAKTKPHRQWTDLSFLELDESDKVWGMHEAQISFVITGSDDYRYVAYGFVDAEIDGVLSDLLPEELGFDQIGAGQDEARLPIWKPRDYFLRVFEIRIEQIRGFWAHLIARVKDSVTKYNNKHPVTLTGHSETKAETEEAFNRTLKIINLLQNLRGVLSATVEAWKSFFAARGDILYFSMSEVGSISRNARLSLQVISRTFEQLEIYLEKLVFLNNGCDLYLKTLELRLTREGAEAADNTWITSEFSITVLYPIALTTAMFSMEPDAIPFAPTRKTFAIVTFLMIGVMFIIRVVFRYTPFYWKALKERTFLWVRKNEGKEMGEGVGERAAGESPDPNYRHNFVPDGVGHLV